MITVRNNFNILEEAIISKLEIVREMLCMKQKVITIIDELTLNYGQGEKWKLKILQKWYETFAENVPSEIMEKEFYQEETCLGIFLHGAVEAKEQEETFELLKTAGSNKLIIYGHDG